jgi:hypothetical protein
MRKAGLLLLSIAAILAAWRWLTKLQVIVIGPKAACGLGYALPNWKGEWVATFGGVHDGG